MHSPSLKSLVEALLFASDEPVTTERIARLLKTKKFDVTLGRVSTEIQSLQLDYNQRGIELVEVSGGFKFKTRSTYKNYISALWGDRKPRYSRAFLETIAIIAYKQPVTRGDIEEIRGVVVSSSIMRQLLDRGWIKSVGVKEVPGRPTLYGTTDSFLEYFGLSSIEKLPSLEEFEVGDFFNKIENEIEP